MNFLEQLEKNKTLHAVAFLAGIGASVVIIYTFSLQAILNKRELERQNAVE